MKLTEEIATNIGKNARVILNVDEDKEKIIIYGAIGLFQILWSVLWTMVIGMVFGVVYEVLLFSIVVSVLKKYSGGAHASSPGRCIFIGVSVATGFGLLIKIVLTKQNIYFVSIIGFISILIAFIIVLKLAPVESENKPISSVEMRKKLKHKSEVIIIIYLIIMTITLLLFINSGNTYFLKAFECISLAALWQAIMLTHRGINILNKVDFILNFKR
ncbi:MAG: accessory gene regulator ArgB-like protein [Clostridiaceae bacterium]